MSDNRIYFPFSKPPVTGGDFVACDHIAELRRQGFDATALYLAGDDGLTQFPVPVLRGLDLAIRDGDMFVAGEIHRDVFENLRHFDCLTVMLNQNPFYSFVGFDSARGINAYPFAAIITPSDIAARILRDAGVVKPMRTIHPALPAMFRPAPRKTLQIAYSPSKRSEEAEFVKWAFRSGDDRFASIPWVALDGLPRETCARIMGESALYAAFPNLESLGLMSLEAMASGCHVVGYTGIGGDEYALPANGDWIAEGDHAGFVAKLKSACALAASSAPDPMVAAGREAAAEYSDSRFRARIAEVYGAIMGADAGRYRI